MATPSAMSLSRFAMMCLSSFQLVLGGGEIGLAVLVLFVVVGPLLPEQPDHVVDHPDMFCEIVGPVPDLHGRSTSM